MKYDLNDKETKDLQKEIGSRDIIIIDESSFIGINSLCILDEILRKVGKKDSEFSKFKIIYCGDFNQLKCVGDTEIYKPEDEDVVETMVNHNKQLEEEFDGDIDINKIEGEVSDKQREEIFDLNGERADTPNDIIGSDIFDEVKEKAKKKQKREN